MRALSSTRRTSHRTSSSEHVSCTCSTRRLPRGFPDLRWGFVEASAQWIPWVAHEAARRFEAAGKPFPDHVFKEYRIYVTCQADDDLPSIMQYSGEDNIVTGTDYGLQDTSSDVNTFTILRRRTDVDPAVLGKIFQDNPSARYALCVGAADRRCLIRG